MSKLVIGLALAFSGASAMACPDGFKAMDAKAPEAQKSAVAEQPAYSPARSDSSKAKVVKTSTKPAVAAVSPAEVKRPSGS